MSENKIPGNERNIVHDKKQTQEQILEYKKRIEGLIVVGLKDVRGAHKERAERAGA